MIYRSRNFKILKNAEGKPTESQELGFGTQPSTGHQRLVNADGTFNYRRINDRRSVLADAFHSLVAMSWGKFGVMLFGAFFVTNLLFAILYYALGIEHLAGVIGDSFFEKFAEAFFFSTQTLTTLGYGRISPTGFVTSLVASIESMLGLISFALATGLLYGRFSHPDAKLLYTDKAIIAPYRGGIGLMFRTANGRRTQLIEVEATVMLARNEMVDGKSVRKFYRLGLELPRINYLALSWTVVHPIIESSPLFGLTMKDLQETDTELLVMLKAFDETYSQTVYSRTSYSSDQFVWGAKFVTMMGADPDGVTVLDLDKLNAYQAVVLPDNQAI